MRPLAYLPTTLSLIISYTALLSTAQELTHLIKRQEGNSWYFFGCFRELTEGLRVLNHQFTLEPGFFSVSVCTQVCYDRGYHISAVQNGNECWCDNAMSSRAVQLAQSECNLPCANNPTEICGGSGKLQMYYDQPGGAAHVNPIAPPSVGQRPRMFTLLGCFLDSAGNRGLRGNMRETVQNTAGTCSEWCYSLGFKYAGVEWGKECFCGSTVYQSTVVPDSDCYQACSGESTQACGAPNCINIYESQTPPSIPTPQSIVQVGSPPSQYRHIGCYVDTVSPRTFDEYTFSSSSAMTATSCATACYQRGFSFAGVEYAKECFCSETSPPSVQLDNGQCNMPCSGDSRYTCGGSARMNVYRLV